MEDQSPEAVDVVIVNYRSYDELRRCLASLEPSRGAIGQITVIDHESNLEEAGRISASFGWTQIVERSTNEGFATGVNLGARRTRAPFIMLLNPDCVVDSDAVTRLLAYAQTRPDAGIVGPRILNTNGTVQGSARRFPGVSDRGGRPKLMAHEALSEQSAVAAQPPRARPTGDAAERGLGIRRVHARAADGVRPGRGNG